VPRRLTDEQFHDLVDWARSLPGAFERRRRLLHASRINVRGSDRLPPRAQTTLGRLRRTIRDMAPPPTTSELRAFVRELDDLARSGWDLLQKAWPDTAALRRLG